MSCEHIWGPHTTGDGCTRCGTWRYGPGHAKELDAALSESRAREAQLRSALTTVGGLAEFGEDSEDPLFVKIRRVAIAALASSDAPACSGEWVGDSGGHRTHAPCGRPADWWHPDDPYAYCDVHLVEHDRKLYVRVRHEAPPESPGELTAADWDNLADLVEWAATTYRGMSAPWVRRDAGALLDKVSACAARAKGKK